MRNIVLYFKCLVIKKITFNTFLNAELFKIIRNFK